MAKCKGWARQFWVVGTGDGGPVGCGCPAGDALGGAVLRGRAAAHKKPAPAVAMLSIVELLVTVLCVLYSAYCFLAVDEAFLV